MENRYCSFCGSKIEYGTGKMYVRRDGSILYFDKSKCEKNYLKLHREPRRVTWTAAGREEKSQRVKFSKEMPQKSSADEAGQNKQQGEQLEPPKLS